jgi:hypothetical protein
VKRLLSALGIYAIWRLWLIVVAGLATSLIPFVPTFTTLISFGRDLPWWQWVWANFDGVIFLLIAKNGYSTSEVPFFPLYPILIGKLTEATMLPHLQSGLLVAALSFAVGIVFVWKLLKLEKKTILWPLIFLLILSYPTAYHYASVYNDSVFFALASATLFFARKRQFWIAALLGGLATLARLNGLALFFVLASEYFFSFIPEKQAWNFGQWPKALLKAIHPKSIIVSGILFAVLIPLAFVAYLGFIEQKFGDWHLFFSGVEVWHRSKITFPLRTFWRYVKILFISPRFTFVYLIAALEALFTVFYMAILFFSWKKIPPTFWVMMFFHWLIPVLTGTLQGMPRYGLHMFPMYYCLALFLQKRPTWQRRAVLGIFLLLQVFYVMYFTRGYFVT